jgi:hypothetical protein
MDPRIQIRTRIHPKMVMNLQHCYKQKFLNVVGKKYPIPVKFGLFGGIGRYFIENFGGSSFNFVTL